MKRLDRYLPRCRSRPSPAARLLDLALAALLPVTGLGAPLKYRLPLMADTLVAMARDGGAVRLEADVYRQDPDIGILAMEAEHAREFAEGAAAGERTRIAEGEGASGRRYVSGPERLAFKCELAAPGVYALAARIRHDAGVFFRFDLEPGPGGHWANSEPEQDWAWCPLEMKMTLEPGVHVLTLDFQNREKTGFAEADIDCLVLYPAAHIFDKQVSLDELLDVLDEGDEAARAELGDGLGSTGPVSLPSGAGPAESKRGFVARGELHFAVLDTPAGFRGLSFEAALVRNGAQAKWQCRGDAAAEWQETAPGAPLPEGDELHLRLLLDRGVEEQSPVFEQAFLNLQVDPAALLTLENAHARLVFHERSGSLLGLYQKSASRWLTLFPLLREPFRLVELTSDTRDLRAIHDAPVFDRYERIEPNGLALHYRVGDSGPEIVDTFMMDDSPLVKRRTRIVNGSNRDIRRVDLPLDYIAFSEAQGDVRVVLPTGLWGGGHGSRVTFPGLACMGWLDCYDDDGGLYLGLHDPELNVTIVSCPRQGGRPFVGYELGHWRSVPPGSEYTLETVLGIHPGDWHWGADRYREWAETCLAHPDNPPWLVESHGWLNWGGEVTLATRKSTGFLPDAEWYGFSHGQFWSHSADEVSCGIFPMQNPRLGTAAQAKADADRVRRGGGRLGYYICSHRWHEGFAHGERIGNNYRRFFPDDVRIETPSWAFEHASKHAGGGPVRWHASEIYETNRPLSMCTASEGWQEHQLYWVQKWCEDFGVDCAYFDGGGVHSALCFDESHPHGRHPGRAAAGLAGIMREAIVACRTVNPGFVTAMEGASAAVGQYGNINLISGSPSYGFGREYLYTFPDRLIYRGDSNGCFVWTGGTRKNFLCRLFLFHRYDLVLDAAARIWLKDVVMLRERTRDWMYRGRFMDDVGLALRPDGPINPRCLRAAWFLYDRDGDRGALINVDNRYVGDYEGEVSGTIALAFRRFGRPRVGAVYGYDGSVSVFEPRIVGDDAVLPIPQQRIAGVLLASELAPDRDVRMHAYQQLDAGLDGFNVWIANLGQRSRTLALVLDREAHGASSSVFDAPAREVTVGPLSSRHVFYPVPDLQDLDDRVRLELRATNGAGVAASCRLLLAPPLRNRGFEQNANRDNTPDGWLSFNKYWTDELMRFVHERDLREYSVPLSDEAHSGRHGIRIDGELRYTIDPVPGEELEKRLNGAWQQVHQSWTREVSQYAILKRATEYTFACMVRRRDALTPYRVVLDEHVEHGQRSQSQALFELEQSPADPVGEWFRIETVFKTAPIPAAHCLTLQGGHPDHPVWFDDLRLAERIAVER